MGSIFQKNKKIFIGQLIIIISCVITLLCFSQASFAQGKVPANVFADDDNDNEAQGVDEKTQVKDEGSERDQYLSDISKHSNAYRVLGRELTPLELKALNGVTLNYQQVIDNYLYKEDHLVVIRGAITVGEAKNASEILKAYHPSKEKPYEEVVKDFLNYREKYGSVLKAVQSENNLRLNDQEIFEDAALDAYEEVFGIQSDDLTNEDKQDLFNLLKGKNALTYTKMIVVLIDTMTPKDKKDILFSLLDEINRADLKKNQKFTNKILEQKFTNKNLKKLLQELKK